MLKSSSTALALVAAIAASPVFAQGNAGQYLAARQAGMASDYKAAAEYFSRALMRDRSNPVLLENAVTSYIGLGDLDRAIIVADQMSQIGAISQVANLAIIGKYVRDENFDALIDDLKAGDVVGPLFDGLAGAWALVGAGRMGEAVRAFDEVASTSGLEAFGLYHKSLALAVVGDFEGADSILSGAEGTELRLTRRGLIAHAQVLSQLERNDDALALIEELFGATLDPELAALRSRLENGETVPFTAVERAADGIAEVFYTIAAALETEAQPAFTLLYARMAHLLRPDLVDAILLSARLLEDLERYALVTEAYDLVPRGHPSFLFAELGRADALRRSDRFDEAIEVLKQLSESYGNLPRVHRALGNTYRAVERWEDAIAAYDRAVALIEEPEQSDWFTYYVRGTAYERAGNWPAAEADFRAAMELDDNQPLLLNYLGYSLVEQRTNLDEALALIRKALDNDPDSGYITDSLGWVFYRLGRYEDAIAPMERAVELMPVDPIINDHLGDVYWAVGRTREAEFQWQRALSFDPEPDEAERIRRKLEVGLDVVLEEEGAEPLQVANDDG